jgi:hypothetical protein
MPILRPRNHGNGLAPTWLDGIRQRPVSNQSLKHLIHPINSMCSEHVRTGGIRLCPVHQLTAFFLAFLTLSAAKNIYARLARSLHLLSCQLGDEIPASGIKVLFGTGGGFETLTDSRGRKIMLWTIFVILLVLWLLGLIGGVGGGLVHLLLVIAAIVLVLNLLSGRRTVV